MRQLKGFLRVLYLSKKLTEFANTVNKSGRLAGNVAEIAFHFLLLMDLNEKFIISSSVSLTFLVSKN
jgi:hypothetical protein